MIVREAEGMDELRAITDLGAAVWGEPLAEPALARAIQHAGGYVAGAWEDDTLVGGSLAFIGLHGDEVVLHSHVTSVAPGRIGQGIGPALKWHQRGWCLDHGVGAVEWTYDPLVARNSWFNLAKLGARAVAYEVDFYGRLDTAIERGEESDRCLVRWDLRSPQVEAASDGRTVPLEPDTLRAKGMSVLLDADDDQPLPGAPWEGGMALARLPSDIERLRIDRPDVAKAWRRALRDTVGTAMVRGAHLTNASRDGWVMLVPAR